MALKLKRIFKTSIMFKFFIPLFLLLSTQQCQTKDTNNKEESNQTKKSMIEETPKSTIIHDIWVLTHIENIAIDSFRFSNPPVLEVNTTEMKVGGNDGCNNYFGPIELLDGNQIKLGNLMSTKKYCMNTDDAIYNELMQEVTRYEINDLQLKLFKDKQVLLTFKKVD